MSELPEFMGAGSEPGVLLWRIENFEPIKQDIPADASELKEIVLFSGDSYILLHSYHAHAQTTALKHDLYFWLGSTSTHDERGTAAYLTVCLDDSLGGVPVQYREVQFFESEKFVRLVKNITYMEGGVPSGFTNVADVLSKQNEAVLFQVKGHPKHRSIAPIISSIPACAKNMNHGDSFILSTPKTAFVWHGDDALPQERFAASQFASSLLKMTKVVDVEDPAFFEHLEGSFEDVQPSADLAEDEEHLEGYTPVMFVLGKEQTDTTVSEDAVYIVDGGMHIYTYIGENVSSDVKKTAMRTVEEFLTGRDGSEVVYIRQQNIERAPHFNDLVSKVSKVECM